VAAAAILSMRGQKQHRHLSTMYLPQGSKKKQETLYERLYRQVLINNAFLAK